MNKPDELTVERVELNRMGHGHVYLSNGMRLGKVLGVDVEARPRDMGLRVTLHLPYAGLTIGAGEGEGQSLDPDPV